MFLHYLGQICVYILTSSVVPLLKMFSPELLKVTKSLKNTTYHEDDAEEVKLSLRLLCEVVHTNTQAHFLTLANRWCVFACVQASSTLSCTCCVKAKLHLHNKLTPCDGHTASGFELTFSEFRIASVSF